MKRGDEEMPEISVIVPVYNVEKYINECIESILAQTFADFELILVDDGSTDNSGVICDKYAERDPRVKVIHKENGGVSSARNIGIKESKGAFITFIDSDDMVDIDYFMDAIQETCSRFVDVYISGLHMETWNSQVIIDMKEYTIANAGEYSVKELLDNLEIKYPLICICGPWCKLFRSELIKKSDIKFDTSMSLGEDTNFNIDYLEKCRNVLFSNKCFYHYRRGNDDSLFSRFHKDTFEIHKKVSKKILALMCRNKCEQITIIRYKNIAFSQYIGCIHTFFRFCSSTTHLEKVELVKKIATDDITKNLKVKHVKGKNKLFLLLLKYNLDNIVLFLFWFHYRVVKRVKHEK